MGKFVFPKGSKLWGRAEGGISCSSKKKQTLGGKGVCFCMQKQTLEGVCLFLLQQTNSEGADKSPTQTNAEGGEAYKKNKL